ncbi:hypothetical protein JTE90_021911 [Oedothorax gibbosus]|uniref:Uncharacterized protein n=1 Tax=Oedothorax gibbosus TaxID=931172 RepID=A0AAV6VVW3_9ARAC|nr:hypothetical protein JTE90_021911 [Oedothorax gibbosus]
MSSKSSNLSSDDSVQSDIKTVTDILLDAVEDMTTSGQDKDATTSHRNEKDSEQHSNLHQLDDYEGKEITKQLSDPGVNIVDDADTDFEYSLIEDLEGNPGWSESSDETTMDDEVGLLLYRSSDYNSGSSDEDIFAALEDARNLDDDDFLPSDPSAEDVADADEAARFAAEIEFLRLMGLFVFVEPEPEEQGAGDSAFDPEEPPHLMDID